MATRTRRTSTTKPALKSVPAETPVDELEFDLDELELDEAPAETPKPAPKRKVTPKAKPAPVVVEEEDEEELTFDEVEEEEPVPAPKVEKAKTAKPKTTQQAVTDAGSSGQFLSGYVKGHFGIDLSPDDAQEIRETLTVAGVDYEHPLLERLLGASSAQLVPTPALKRTVNLNRPAAKAAPKAKAAGAPKKAAVSDDGLNLAEVRAWAQANGYEVGDRGRIKQEIKDAFVEANG